MLESSPTGSITKTGFTTSETPTDFIQSPVPEYTSNSDGSSDLLTPPVRREYADPPPYKPRTPDSSSLTMSKLRRTRSISFGERDARKRRRRAQSNRNRRLRERDFKLHSSWWHGSCQLTWQGDEYNHFYQRRNNVPLGISDQYSSNFPSFESSRTSTFTVVQPLARRWSCMEIRGQAHVDSQAPCKTAPLTGSTSFMDQLVSQYLETQPRSSTSGTAIAQNHDIIRTIWKTLTTHKVPSLEVPDLITLRRATVSQRPKMTEAEDVDISVEESEIYSDEDGTPESYIITKGDINAITDLIRAALYDNRHTNVGFVNNPPSGNMPRAPTFTEKGLVVGAGTVVESTISSAEVQLCLSDGHQPPNFLHVVSETTVVTPTPVLPSKKSLHEILWEGNISPTTSEEAMAPLKSAGSFDNADDVIAPEHDFPTPMTLRIPDSAHYFDPNCLSPEKNHWPFRSPRDEIDFVFPSSSDIVDTLAKIEAPSITSPVRSSRPTLKSHGATMQVPQIEKPSPLLSPIEWTRKDSLQDVLSFPPLPARSSNDWHSPLPPVDCPTLVTRSLYDIGLDINCGPPTPSILTCQVLSPQPSRTSWIRTAESSAKVSRVPSVAFDPGYVVCQKSLRNPHTDVPIIEETFAVEEATGLSTSAPIMSDFVAEITQGIKRVKTIDNVHKGERPGHWSPYRPPSIYPAAVTPSPSERSTDEDKQLSTKIGNKPSNLKASIDSLDLLQNTSPPSPGTPWPVQHGIEMQLGGMALHEDCSAHVCDDCAMDPRFLE